MSGHSERFSPAEFAAKLQHEQQGQGAELKGQIAGLQWLDQEGASQAFSRLAEEIRAYLSAPRGLSDDERRQYNEMLNRAVLGFTQEREQVLAIIADRLIQLRIHSLPDVETPYQTLAEALFAEVIGLNVLELVLAQKDGLEEIQVVGTTIFTVRQGVVTRSVYCFDELKDVERLQQNLVLYNNDRINVRKRWAEVMLQDGSRVTMTGFGFTAKPTLTIRFYTARNVSLMELCGAGYRSMNDRIRHMLLAALKTKYNLVLIGATGSGKTNLMKALIAELPDEERIITLEGRFEMMLGRDFPSKNIVEYETDEEDERHAFAQAFKLALRQSPNRIIHAEIRDSDANVYVRACTRGHSGSMTTVHANRIEDVPEAVCDMCMLDGRGMNPERLVKRITQYVTELGIELRLVNGRRVIYRIGELRWEQDSVQVREWARFNEELDDWEFPEPISERAAKVVFREGVQP